MEKEKKKKYALTYLETSQQDFYGYDGDGDSDPPPDLPYK